MFSAAMVGGMVIIALFTAAMKVVCSLPTTYIVQRLWPHVLLANHSMSRVT